ncbi:unnamed protein product [Symbiodinium natans]|uniref:Uncharacterized protein n=1 Tax=Symbiodinium natans TaxID=878477 RepID=A0A812MSM2_9DINO|nr:unnamed protein product [Symbiodinium natans]
MASGLFDEHETEAAAADAPAAGRRTKLYPWDSVASQLFEPYGECPINGMSLKDVWNGAAAGNKKAAYHSHLCADQEADPWHVGAGISLTAAALSAAIEHFKKPEMKKLIVPEYYNKAEEEIKELEPLLALLNLGKGSQSQRDTGTFRSAKRHKATATASATTGSQAEILDAASKFYKWLTRPKSAFRSMLFLLSGANTFFSGHCADVVARAGIENKPITEEQFVAAMKARSQKMPVPAGAGPKGSDATGLFDS